MTTYGQSVVVVTERARCSAFRWHLWSSELEVLFIEDDVGLRQRLDVGQRPDLLIADVDFSSHVWCTLLRSLRDAGIRAKVFVCTFRQGQPICGEVIARGGYYALAPPHQWAPLSHVLPELNKSARRSNRTGT